MMYGEEFEKMYTDYEKQAKEEKSKHMSCGRKF
jgi:hypothetical protein